MKVLTSLRVMMTSVCPRRLAVGTLLLAGCSGGSGSPVAPGQPSVGSVAGTIVRTQEATPIAGATVRIDQWLTTTDGDGRFSMVGLPTFQMPSFSVTAPGYLNRQSHVGLGGTRSGIVLDLIPDADPFLIDFYRQLVRDALESTVGLRATRPWTIPPAFYFKTTHDPSGVEVPLEVIDAIKNIFANAVRELSGGRLEVAAFDAGPDSKPSTHGWVNVFFQSELTRPNYAGLATVGGDQGAIWLRYDPEAPRPPVGDGSGCRLRVVEVAEHEIRHTMGFYHTAAAYEPYWRDPECDGAGLSDALRYHAAVMYSRPPGNLDPDTDPPSFSFAVTGEGRQPVVSCTLAR